MVDIQPAAAEIRREKKKDRWKGKNIMAPLLHRAAIKKAITIADFVSGA